MNEKYNVVKMVFQAKMQDSKILKGIIEAVSVIIDETYMKVDEKGVNFLAMDESHICMLHIDMPKEMFDEYTAPESPENLGLNLEDMSKIGKRVGASDSIMLEHAKDSEKFLVKLKSAGVRTFSLRLVDIDEEKIPPTVELDVKFTATVTLDSAIIDQGIKDSEIYQDTMEITMNKEGVKFFAEGEVGDVEYNLSKDQLVSSDIKTEQADKDGKMVPVPPARGVFSLSFLKNIMKASTIADKVTLSLAENSPIQFVFPIGEGKGMITYVLAPRVEESGEDNQTK
jgi:proliferating cell nuclear antigen